MRLKINLDINKTPVKNVVVETSKRLNAILGINHKWHDLERKPYTCSLISGGRLKGENIEFNGNAHFYINTEDEEVIKQIVNNKGLNFNIETVDVFKGYNILSVDRVRYKISGKNKWVTNENKKDFIKYVKDKYAVEIQILKFSNSVVYYKNNSKISVSNLLIRIDSEKNVSNLFETGIGGSCSLGFGFVEPIYKK